MNGLPSFADPANLEPRAEPETIVIKANETSLDLLQAIYRCATLPLSTRMRAAMAAIQFEHPKLAVTANVSGDHEFGFRLDQAIQRSGTAPKVIEHQPTQDRPTFAFALKAHAWSRTR